MGQITLTEDLLGNLNLEIERKFDISLYGSGQWGHIWLGRFLAWLHNGHQLKIISQLHRTSVRHPPVQVAQVN